MEKAPHKSECISCKGCEYWVSESGKGNLCIFPRQQAWQKSKLVLLICGILQWCRTELTTWQEEWPSLLCQRVYFDTEAKVEWWTTDWWLVHLSVTKVERIAVP